MFCCHSAPWPLDLLILKTLSQLGSMHGYGIMMHIRRVTDGLLIVEEGSLYPALHPMEHAWLGPASWAINDYGRKAKWYALTRAGQNHGTPRGQHIALRYRVRSEAPRGLGGATGSSQLFTSFHSC